MSIKDLWKILKPMPLVSLILTYILGIGLVQYVRNFHGWALAIQGGMFLILMSVSTELLRYLQRVKENLPENLTLKEIRQKRWQIALILATLLTVSITIFVDWMVRDILSQGLVFLVIGFLGLLITYFHSDTYRALTPYKILIESFIYVVIPPALAYFLNSSEPHRFLTQVVIGFIPSYIAYGLLMQLKSYRNDQKYGKLTFVTYSGWEKAMVIHNALILLSYAIFAFIVIIGFPWFIIWPVFLTLPIGLVEIWLMERVRRGSKPLWRLMQFASVCVFIIPIYLLGFAFWIR